MLDFDGGSKLELGDENDDVCGGGAWVPSLSDDGVRLLVCDVCVTSCSLLKKGLGPSRAWRFNYTKAWNLLKHKKSF